jgi:diguanylate cyclase (GGDEF)-like protein
MKRRIIAPLVVLCVAAALGAAVAAWQVSVSSAALRETERLRRTAGAHGTLLAAVQSVQSTLLAPSGAAPYQTAADAAESLRQAGAGCAACHHAPASASRLDGILTLLDDYRGAVARYGAQSGTPAGGRLRTEAAARGSAVLAEAVQMAGRPGPVLSEDAVPARWALPLLLVLAGATVVLGVVVSRNLLQAVVRPVHALIQATRRLAAGDLGSTIEGRHDAEFGELAAHFNDMSRSLQSSYAKLEGEIAERRKTEEQLKHNAFHDPLTGLPNRALFMNRLQHVIEAKQRRAITPNYAILFCDLDRFKMTNDSLGHAIGDQLLILVGRRLIDCVRPGDTVARLGGDEFAILLETIGEPAHAVEVAKRVQSKMTAPIDVKGNVVYASLSIGIAVGSERYERPEQGLRDADIAMYEAKGRGSAQYEVFDARMHANILDKMQLEADLRKAIEHREFVLYYQPIMDLKSQRLTGFEALVRWNHPTRGLVYPMEFIPLAEESGLINGIGDWILREACSELKQFQARHPMDPPLTMSVNISSKQFAQPDLVTRVAGHVAETGIDPRRLALEITESMIMANIDDAAKVMARLREMGIQIHIDDFGTGHSSLSYLHRFPVSALKIDRSFISKLSADGANRQIVQSIISLASSLHVEVIAEGVELEHQLSNVRELHCGYGQGYLFARPMARDAVDAWVRGQKPPV